MNTELEQYEPIWQYEVEENAILDITGLQLFIWSNGMSVVGFDETGQPQKIKTYFFPRPWDQEFMEEIFINEPLFAGEETFKSIWITEERSLLIPESLFNQGYATDWIKKFHFLEETETLFDDSLKPALKAQIIFPIPENLKNLLNHYFEEVAVKAFSKIALSLPEENTGTIIKIVNLPRLVLFSLQENGKNILHQIAHYEKTEDIIYKIAIILQEKNINQDQVKISLSGIAPFYNNIIEELQNFFEIQEDLTDTTQATINFFKKTYLCE